MTAPPMPPLPPPQPQQGYFPPIYLPPAQPRGGFLRAIATTLVVSLFGFSITLNIYLILFSGVLGGGPVHKTTVRQGSSDNVIAVVPVYGAITDATAAEFNELLGEVEANPHVKAVVLEVNTPGGAVTASDVMYDRILRLKKDKGVKVVVSMGALATSGGYYITCAADAAVAQRTTWTGNIGVLLPRYNLHKLAEQYGFEDTTIKSTGATFKDAGSMFKEDTPEQTAYFQKLADDAFATFKSVVVTGRSLSPATVDQIANGKIYNGEDAKRLSLVDAVGYLDDAIDLAENKAGLAKGIASAVRDEKKRGLFDSLGGSASNSSGSKISAQVGGVPLSIDRALIDDLFSPRPMYLWRGQ
ncbi:MAG: signal peptide peptidase SppA [Tepidisphaeraceae bacterium]